MAGRVGRRERASGRLWQAKRRAPQLHSLCPPPPSSPRTTMGGGGHAASLRPPPTNRHASAADAPPLPPPGNAQKSAIARAKTAEKAKKGGSGAWGGGRGPGGGRRGAGRPPLPTARLASARGDAERLPRPPFLPQAPS